MKESFTILLVLVVIFMVYKGMSSSPKSNEIKAAIDAGALVVDVRTPGEFQSGSFPGAKNIPLDTVTARIKEFGDKSKPVIVFCAAGGRSSQAKSILESNGFQKVYNAGGINDILSLK
jgi:phage shock protein E